MYSHDSAASLSLRDLLAYAQSDLLESLGQWSLRRELKRNERHLEVIARQLENDLKAQRMLHGRQAAIKAAIHAA